MTQEINNNNNSVIDITKDDDLLLHKSVIDEVTEIEFHGGCPDGIGAVFPFYLKRKNDYKNNKLRIHGVSHHESPNLNKFNNKTVLFLDYCYGVDDLLAICNVAKEVWVLDHHNTTLNTQNIIEFASNVYSQDVRVEDSNNINDYIKKPINLHWIVDMNRSAAQIAWDFVFPNTKRPWFIEIIADRDLWKWEIPLSKEIGKSLYYYDYYRWESMETFYLMSDKESKKFQSNLAKYGKILLDQEKKDIYYCANRAVLCEFMGYKVKLTNCPPNLRSEVGNYLAGDECDIAAMWRYDFLQDQYWISMRVKDGSTINLAKFAENFGGGGHYQAAGFTIHGSKSNIWLEADSIKRINLAHGNLHDYFIILQT